MARHSRHGGGMMQGEERSLPDPVRCLLDKWACGVVDVVASMADRKPEARWEAAGAPPADADLLWWEQPFQAAPGAMVWVATPRATWEYAGTLTLKSAGLETVETNE